MNAKKCKALRRQARKITIGMPDRKLVSDRNGFTKINSENTFRGTYRMMKRG